MGPARPEKLGSLIHYAAIKNFNGRNLVQGGEMGARAPPATLSPAATAAGGLFSDSPSISPGEIKRGPSESDAKRKTQKRGPEDRAD